MPKRSSTALDPVRNARRVVLESVESTESMSVTLISQVMSAMGRKGGKIGGKRRLITMTPEHRRQVAVNAAKTRWAKTKPKAKRVRKTGS